MTPEEIVNEVRELCVEMHSNLYFGPYEVVFPARCIPGLVNTYFNDKSVMERILELPRVDQVLLRKNPDCPLTVRDLFLGVMVSRLVGPGEGLGVKPAAPSSGTGA